MRPTHAVRSGGSYSTGIVGLACFALLLLIPYGIATHSDAQSPFFEDDQEGTVIHYNLLQDTDSELDPVPGEVVNRTFTNERHHNYLVINQTILASIQMTTSFQEGGDGTWQYDVFIDGIHLPQCTWFVRTLDPGLFGGDRIASPSFPITCDANGDLAPGEHTFTIERSVESGNPADLEATTISVLLQRQDIVLTSEPTAFEHATGLTAFEFALIIAMPLVGILLWRTRRDIGVSLFGTLLVLSTVGLLFSIIASSNGAAWAFLFSYGLILMALWLYQTLMVLMDAASKRRTGGK